MVQDNRYIGGGRLYFTPEGGAEIEFAELQEGKIKIDSTTKEAYDKATSMKKQVDVVATDVKASLDFSCQKFTKEARTIASLGTATTETFAVGDTLPDGTVATAETTLDVIQAGTKPLIKGSFRFVGDKDGEKYPVLIVDKATVKPSGDIALMSDDFAKLSFTGSILVNDSGVFYKEYMMATV